MPKESRTRMMARRCIGSVYRNPSVGGARNDKALATGELHRLPDRSGGPVPGRAVGSMNEADRLIWANCPANTLELRKSHPVINLVLGPQAAAAQLDQRHSD